MVTYLESFRQNSFPIDSQIGSEIVYISIDKLFVFDGVVDTITKQLLQFIRKDRTKSKNLFVDCFIYFRCDNREIGVCQDTNVKEFEKRVRSLCRTNLAPLSVLTQLGSTLPSPIVTSSTVENIVTEEKIIGFTKTN